MQSAGGALAATADPGEKIGDIGTNLMIAGIIWQVVGASFSSSSRMSANILTVLVIFGILVAEYSVRTWRRRNRLSVSTLELWANRRFRYFCGAIVTAYTTILIRCAYRIPELLGGWGGELMRIEIEFVILEGVMIVLTVTAMTVFHPGLCVPALGNTMGKKAKYAKTSNSETEIEMLKPGETASTPDTAYEPYRT
jgi:hypothetical protein